MSSEKREYSFERHLLFTPGPLNTSKRVKESMLEDLGSRDVKFIKMIKDVRSDLLDLCHVEKGQYESIIVQGCGTMSIESVLSSLIDPEIHRLLVLINGEYGRRMAQVAEIHGIKVERLEFPESMAVPVDSVVEKVKSLIDGSVSPKLSHVGIVHLETSAGSLNPAAEIGRAIKAIDPNIHFYVDAMSSFGAVEIDLKEFGPADVLVSSSNKCIQGVPGFGFVIAKTDIISNPPKKEKRTLTLDLHDQWKGLETTGQFRFTPPTQAIAAFHSALAEFKEETPSGRHSRYLNNKNLLVNEMEKMGFKEYLPREIQGPVITTFWQPDHPNFDFVQFYSELSKRGCAIYPGKVTKANLFRIGTIGEIYEKDIRYLLSCIKEIKADMGF